MRRHITGILLEDFQSHARTELTLVPGLNVLVGESNTGKSAVLRALNWVLYSQPYGTAYIRSGRPGCRVTLEYDDGTRLARVRDFDHNRYLISYPHGLNKSIPAADNEAPAEIKAVLGARSLRLSDGHTVHLNAATQLEGPFLLCDSGLVLGEVISRLSGADLVNRARDVCRGTLAEQETADQTTLKDACDLLAASASLAYARKQRDLEDFLTKALTFVFGPRLSCRIVSEVRDGRLLAHPAVVSDTKAPLHSGNMLERTGAGIVDVIALALRIALLEGWSPRSLGPLLIDEPVKHLGDQYSFSLSRFIKAAADGFERQILLTTHNQHLTGTADLLYVLELRSGASVAHARGSSVRNAIRQGRLDPRG